MVVDSTNDSTIHSGHFMVSCIHEDEDSKVDESRINNSSATAQQLTQPCKFAARRANLASIDASLTKLFECMTLAYSGKIVSPKWKNFRGIKVKLKDKIRLNNIIWREWHMQFRQRKKPIVCQFEAPIADRTHTKPEAVVLEGKYWKRRLQCVTTEYTKWRTFFKDRFAKQSSYCTSSTSTQVLLERVGQAESVAGRGTVTPAAVMSADDQMITEDDFAMDFSDSLFSALNQPFVFPDPKEMSQSGFSDIIQPGLIQLQPSFESYMDTVSPLVSLSDVISLNRDSGNFNSNIGSCDEALFTMDSNASFYIRQIKEQLMSIEVVLQTSAAQSTPPPPQLAEQTSSSQLHFIDTHQPGTPASFKQPDTSSSATTASVDIPSTQSFREPLWSTSSSDCNLLDMLSASDQSTLDTTISELLTVDDSTANLVAAALCESTGVVLVSSPNEAEQMRTHQQQQQQQQQQFVQQQHQRNLYKAQQDVQTLPWHRHQLQQQPQQWQIVQKATEQQQKQTLQQPQVKQQSQRHLLAADDRHHKQSLAQTAVKKHVNFCLPQFVGRDGVTSMTEQNIAPKHHKRILEALLTQENEEMKDTTFHLTASNTSQKPVRLQTAAGLNDTQSSTSNIQQNLSTAATTTSQVAGNGHNARCFTSLLEGEELVSQTENPANTVADDDVQPTANQQRGYHMTAEYKRRCNIKSGFETLNRLVPALSHQSTGKINKATTLTKAAEYCQHLKDERRHLLEEAAQLSKEVESLHDDISRFQSELPASGAPVSHCSSQSSRMSQLCDSYVRTHTLANWKFWIFSLIIRPLFESYNTAVTSVHSNEEFNRSVVAWLQQHCSLVALRPGVLNALRQLSTTTSILTDPAAVPQQAADAVKQTTSH